MPKTNFGHGTPVGAEFLNGLKSISFDGQDRDFHYPPLGLSSLEVGGPDGLDSRYITSGTSQPSLSSSGAFVAGTPIFGDKTVTGRWNFGYDFSVSGNPPNTIGNAPQSFTTNSKYLDANGTDSPTIAQKYAALGSADLLTKLVLQEQLEDLEVDNGFYYSIENPACNNYSVNGTSLVICPA
ncbi:hypothetical protein SCBWM1_gp177 [Synechococcus phage S-CBWM1]|uniref:Uncharacterized protein n=1 Tax=Synechococcus phage S-CBWM1 TaxID=2053653 RepID=A0A3G1L3U8_9CAUD|nr:hypothetical protein HOU61_gp020 [Synechococcus phage S-CBWM1]ATW62861.1 hypothetical protein SCBWM1_gp177 [Synechococcus phage S-CBWM1]